MLIGRTGATDSRAPDRLIDHEHLQIDALTGNPDAGPAGRGRTFWRPEWPDSRVRHLGRDELHRVLFLRQDRTEDVSRATGYARTAAPRVRGGGAAGRKGRHSRTEDLRDSDGVAQRLCHRPQSAARVCRGDPWDSRLAAKDGIPVPKIYVIP